MDSELTKSPLHFHEQWSYSLTHSIHGSPVRCSWPYLCSIHSTAHIVWGKSWASTFYSISTENIFFWMLQPCRKLKIERRHLFTEKTKTYILMCGGDFLLWAIRRSSHITNESMCWSCKFKITNTTRTIDGDMIFLRENSNWKKPRREGGKFTISHRLREITGMYWYFF